MVPSAPDTTLPPRVLLHAWCRAVLETLADAGIVEVVISPGSRNSPLTLTALSTRALRCHSVIDERSAGFFALGMARESGVPVALLCTSGTAAAHYYPALIEASYDGIPLVVISADRPEELQNCGAPQTISQRNLFGTFVRSALPLPSPSHSLDTFLRLRRSVHELARAAASPRPGPVHLNVPLRKPLEPATPSTPEEQARVDEFLSGAFETEAVPALAPDLALLVAARRTAKRPLVVSGPMAPGDASLVVELAAVLGAPRLGEFGAPPSAGLDYRAPSLTRAEAPDFLLHVGPPAVSSAWNRAIEFFGGRYFVAPGTEYREPSTRAEATLVAPLASVLAELRRTLANEPLVRGASEYASPLGETSRAVSAALERAADPDGRLDEPAAVRQVLESCPPDTRLVLGNSLSVRLASWVWPALSDPPDPFTARGVNGIDGAIAGAAGIAVASRGRTLALIGDVTFAHDLGSLQLCSGLPLPLVLVVLDNQGGRIFDHLPIKSQLGERESRYFTTETAIDYAAAAQTFGLRFARVTGLGEIPTVIARAFDSHGTTLVHLPTDPSSTPRFLADVRRSLEP